MKKPVSRQAASIWRATSRFAASLPPRSAVRSIVGIAFSAAMVHLSVVRAIVASNYSSIDACPQWYKGAGQAIQDPLMNRRMTRLPRCSACAAGAVLAPNIVRAQAASPIAPSASSCRCAAGGGVDTFARLIAAKAKTQRDINFIVENRTGGNSTIGGLDVQRAAPDGYTVLFHASTHNVARLVLKNAPYDPVADFTPIALAGKAPLVLIVANNRPEKTLAEIIAAAKTGPRRPGPSRPPSSARPAISPMSRSISTPVSNLPIISIAARRRR